MKSSRLLLALSIFTVLLTASFGSPVVSAQEATPAADCPATTVDENIALVTSFVEAIEAQDLAAIDAALADDYSDTANRFGLPVDETTNADEHQLATMFEALYPESTTTLDSIFGVDDKVVATTTLTISGHTATGELVTLDSALEIGGISIFTIECGLIGSSVTVLDGLTLLVGIGAIAPPADMPAATPEA